jgi:hypothetical protein
MIFGGTFEVSWQLLMREACQGQQDEAVGKLDWGVIVSIAF